MALSFRRRLTPRDQPVWAVLGVVSAMAGVVVVRRAQGAATGELSWPSLVLAGTLVALVLAFARRVLAPAPHSGSAGALSDTFQEAPSLPLLRHVPGVVAVLVVLALWPARQPGAGLLLAAPLVAVQLGWADRAVARRRPGGRMTFRSPPRSSTTDGPPARPPRAGRQVGRGPEASPCLARFERRRLAPGEELIVGETRVVVPAGARTGAAHLAFCPPFAQRPTVRCELVSSSDRPHASPPATVRADSIWPHAARLEVRLARPAASATTLRVTFRVQGPVAAPA